MAARKKTRRRPPAPTPKKPRPTERPAPFPIVGIGASAGGLEALIEFLNGLPRNSGLALVVVQHLDPGHKGALVELLQRSTELPVSQVVDGVKVEPEHVYVIPPGRDLSLSDGRLHLQLQHPQRGLHLPIDLFLRTLAADRQEKAIGVILSGMGSDGLLGLRAIKEKAGATFVQDPVSAQFAGMPSSSIDAGLADVVAPARELPARILKYLAHQPVLIVEPKAALRAEGTLEKIFVLLRAQTGNDFSLYKQSTILRRIERRLSLHQVDLDRYLRLLRENPREIELLSKELLIGVTSFFRDSTAWDQLKHDVLPVLLAQRPPGGQLRAWVAGCSTGEEAFSLAMIFKEALEALEPPKNVSLQIFATDLDADAIEYARQAIYPDNIIADVSPERLRRFFIKEDRGYRVGKEIREMVVFAPQNLIMSPPFTRLDLICCRNLLIYLSADLQKKLIPLFHYSLNPGGVLFLGSAETVGPHANLFSAIDAKARLYRRQDHAVAVLPVELPSAALMSQRLADAEAEPFVHKRPAPNLQTLADRVLLQQFAPLGVLCNERGDVLYISSRSGKYLEPAVGKANLNIFAMAKEGLRLDLSSAFASALRKERPVKVRSIKFGSNGGAARVDLTVQKLVEPKELNGTVMVVMADSPDAQAQPPSKRGRAPLSPEQAELQRELTLARDELQTLREEMQSSQEELKSTNEELQSTNEELQSSNEELTTSKEEMQSLNEELQTVNHELEAKVDELSRSNNDMKNLLNSTDIATLFLDADLNVRRFTSPATRIIKLIASDVGRPVTDLVNYLQYSELATDAQEVLHTLVFKERQVSTTDGRWYQMRILPYRTMENRIDGVVITFIDASASKALELALKDQANQLKQMAESLPSMVWGSRPDGSCDYLSLKWVEYTGVSEQQQLGYGWLEQVHPDDRAAVREAWATAVHRAEPFDTELRIRNAAGQWRWFKCRSVAIRDTSGAVLRWWGTHTDVDELKRAAVFAR